MKQEPPSFAAIAVYRTAEQIRSKITAPHTGTAGGRAGSRSQCGRSGRLYRLTRGRMSTDTVMIGVPVDRRLGGAASVATAALVPGPVPAHEEEDIVAGRELARRVGSRCYDSSRPPLCPRRWTDRIGQPVLAQMRLLRLLYLLPLFWACTSTAQELQGDPLAGGELAREVCAACHIVGDDQLVDPDVGAPTFFEVIVDPSVTELSLRAFLQTSHPTMPNLILTLRRPTTSSRTSSASEVFSHRAVQQVARAQPRAFLRAERSQRWRCRVTPGIAGPSSSTDKP
jgi:hypothetical protein